MHDISYHSRSTGAYPPSLDCTFHNMFHHVVHGRLPQETPQNRAVFPPKPYIIPSTKFLASAAKTSSFVSLKRNSTTLDTLISSRYIGISASSTNDGDGTCPNQGVSCPDRRTFPPKTLVSRIILEMRVSYTTPAGERDMPPLEYVHDVAACFSASHATRKVVSGAHVR